jgi:aspartate/methionine/tyrosine aminotransferase
MPALPEFRLESYFARWEFTARYHLTASDAQSMPLAELLELADDDARQRWETLTLGYTESRGLPALREAIAATYEQLTPDDVLCCAGAEEALYLAMQVLLGPADHAVVITPNYQSAETVPMSLCEVTGVALRPEQGWALDLDELRAALRPQSWPRCATSAASRCSATRCTAAWSSRRTRRCRRPPTCRRARCR